VARLAFKDKGAGHKQFEEFLQITNREACDSRNFVQEAVNRALRRIGKRNFNLNQKAIETAKEIQKMDSRSAKWVASDTIRQSTSKAAQERLRS
jgi:3-methyladenine DNA glycosylase AlkD